MADEYALRGPFGGVFLSKAVAETIVDAMIQPEISLYLSEEISDEDATALSAALDNFNTAARRLIAQMDRNLFLLRDCALEAETTTSILRNFNSITMDARDLAKAA